MHVNLNPEEKPDSAPRRTQAERAEATRGALIAAARRLFTERGYEDVAAEEIVRAAGVTRGSCSTPSTCGSRPNRPNG